MMQCTDKYRYYYNLNVFEGRVRLSLILTKLCKESQSIKDT